MRIPSHLRGNERRFGDEQSAGLAPALAVELCDEGDIGDMCLVGSEPRHRGEHDPMLQRDGADLNWCEEVEGCTRHEEDFESGASRLIWFSEFTDWNIRSY